MATPVSPGWGRSLFCCTLHFSLKHKKQSTELWSLNWAVISLYCLLTGTGPKYSDPNWDSNQDLVNLHVYFNACIQITQKISKGLFCIIIYAEILKLSQTLTDNGKCKYFNLVFCAGLQSMSVLFQVRECCRIETSLSIVSPDSTVELWNQTEQKPKLILGFRLYPFLHVKLTTTPPFSKALSSTWHAGLSVTCTKCQRMCLGFLKGSRRIVPGCQGERERRVSEINLSGGIMRLLRDVPGE